MLLNVLLIFAWQMQFATKTCILPHISSNILCSHTFVLVRNNLVISQVKRSKTIYRRCAQLFSCKIKSPQIYGNCCTRSNQKKTSVCFLNNFRLNKTVLIVSVTNFNLWNSDGIGWKIYSKF